MEGPLGVDLASHPASQRSGARAGKAGMRQPPEPPCPFLGLAAALSEDPGHGCAARLRRTRDQLLEEARVLESVIASLADGGQAAWPLEHPALVRGGWPADGGPGRQISEGAEVLPTERPAQPPDECAECPPQPGQGESKSVPVVAVRTAGESTSMPVVAVETAQSTSVPVVAVRTAMPWSLTGTHSSEVAHGHVVDVLDMAVAAVEHQSGGAGTFFSKRSSRHHKVLFNRHQAMGTTFECAFGVLIGTNALVSGVEVQYRSMHMGEEMPCAFLIIRHAYTLLFLLELVARVCKLGPSNLFTKGDVFWAWMDTLVVLMGLLEMAMDIQHQRELSGAGALRNVRLARLVRLTRAFRLIRFVAALRTLVYSIMATLKSLLWAMVLLLMIVYVFGLAFTMETLDHVETQEGLDQSEVAVLLNEWGSLDVSMYTLFQSISGGVSWREPAVPLQNISILPTALFSVYIAFVYFAVLNVVTGVFCSSAVETTQRNPDLVAKSIIDNRRNCADKLQQLFGALDEDGSGLITIDELEVIAEDDLVKAYFQALGIDFRDAWTLFKLIDHSNDGAIKLDDFLKGCEKLRGGATSMEMAEMSYDVRKLAHKVQVLMECMRSKTPGHLSQGTAGAEVRPVPSISLSARHKQAAYRRMASAAASATGSATASLPGARS